MERSFFFFFPVVKVRPYIDVHRHMNFSTFQPCLPRNKGNGVIRTQSFIVMRLLSIPIVPERCEKFSMNARSAPIVHLFLVLIFLSYLVIGLDDGISVCTFNSASSIVDCSNRNTMSNQLPEAEKRLRYDPFPELFSNDAVDAFKRYRRHKREKTDVVENDDQNVDKPKIRKRKGARIQKLDPDDECMDISKYSTVIDL